MSEYLAYTNQSKEVFEKTLESSTRFDFKHIAYSDLSAEKYTVELITEYNISTVKNENIVGGHVSVDGKDKQFYDFENYLDAVDEAITEDVSNISIQHDFRKRVITMPYAEIVKKTIIHWHDGRIMNSESCNTCYGDGKVECITCHGKGEHDCSSCGGRGSSSCSCCGGSGSEDDSHTDHDGHTHHHTKTCNCCGGSGRQRCYSCGGSGDETCGTCSGTGDVTCDFCGGSAVQTRVAEIGTYVLPSFSMHYAADAPVFLSDIIENKLARENYRLECEVVFVSATNDELIKSVLSKHSMTMVVSKFTVILDGKTYLITMFGKNHIIYDSEGILTDVLSDDLKRLIDINLNKMHPKFISKVGIVLKNFMESEIHQNVIDRINLGYDTEMIFNDTGRMLHKTHISTSKVNLTTTLENVMHWVMIFLFAGLLTFIAMLCLYIHFNPKISAFICVGISLVIGIALWASANKIILMWAKNKGGDRLSLFLKNSGLLLGQKTMYVVTAFVLIISASAFFLWH